MIGGQWGAEVVVVEVDRVVADEISSTEGATPAGPMVMGS